jgi:hypothetical protein
MGAITGRWLWNRKEAGKRGGWEAGRLGGVEAGKQGGWEAGKQGGWEAGWRGFVLLPQGEKIVAGGVSPWKREARNRLRVP